MKRESKLHNAAIVGRFATLTSLNRPHPTERASLTNCMQ
jgi:hypothetical protein